MNYAPPTSRDTLLRPVKVMGYMNKYFICDGIRRGTITVSEAMSAHSLSSEELLDWCERYKRAGIDGFRRMNRSRRSRRQIANGVSA
jgi:hypothetical protein